MPSRTLGGQHDVAGHEPGGEGALEGGGFDAVAREQGVAVDEAREGAEVARVGRSDAHRLQAWAPSGAAGVWLGAAAAIARMRSTGAGCVRNSQA